MSAPFAPADELMLDRQLLTVGSVCTGYGGLDAVLTLVLGASTIWTADNDADVGTVLRDRFGDVPNLGDIKSVDWSKIPAPTILCAGFPCQDISPAGKRAGIRPGNRSGLWTWIAYIIGVQRPSYVFIENSRGLTSAKAHSDVEQCPFCVGDGSRHPALRALGRVVGDLAAMGYDTQWGCVRASDVGAPHERHRAFIWAWRRGVDPDPRRSVGPAGIGAGSDEPVSAGRTPDASSDGQRRLVGAHADAGRVGIRGQTGDSPSTPVTTAASVRTGIRGSGQRLRTDDRDARAGLPASADADDSTRAEQDGDQAAGFDASRRRDARRLRGDAADAERVRGQSGRLTASGQAPSGRSSGVSVGSDRARDDADPAVNGRQPRRAERAGVGGRSDAVGDSCASADAERARPARTGRLVEPARGAGSELDGVDAADADSTARQRHEQPGRVAVAGDRVTAADACGSRLEVGRVEPARHERATVGRDRRDGDAFGVALVSALADSPSVGRLCWRSVEISDAIGRTSPRWGDSGDAPPDFVWRVGDDDFSQAIKTWEAITGRRAPLPAVPNRRGDYRLNPRFSEWMMGLPDGWVTAVAGLSRTAQLRIIGNGLVPAQGAFALLLLLDAAVADG